MKTEMEPLLTVFPSLFLCLIVELSEKGKVHDSQAKTYNQQAANFVFRANNSRAAPDEIDLHGLYRTRKIELILDMLKKRYRFLRLE
jgi:hypothetical protein